MTLDDLAAAAKRRSTRRASYRTRDGARIQAAWHPFSRNTAGRVFWKYNGRRITRRNLEKLLDA